MKICKDCIHKFICSILEQQGYQQDCKYFSNRESNNKNKEILLDFYCRCMTTFKKPLSECKQHKYQDGEIICYANCPECGKETWSRYK